MTALLAPCRFIVNLICDLEEVTVNSHADVHRHAFRHMGHHGIFPIQGGKATPPPVRVGTTRALSSPREGFACIFVAEVLPGITRSAFIQVVSLLGEPGSRYATRKTMHVATVAPLYTGSWLSFIRAAENLLN
jgi:hypothetical protein